MCPGWFGCWPLIVSVFLVIYLYKGSDRSGCGEERERERERKIGTRIKV